jgi:hypothetical protein
VHACSYFSAGDLQVRKSIEPWTLMEETVDVKFTDIQKLYQDTAKAPGLVHATDGPTLAGDRYRVTLVPLGRPGQYELLRTEEAVQRMAHGLLHGLAAIHKVGWLCGCFCR